MIKIKKIKVCFTLNVVLGFFLTIFLPHNLNANTNFNYILVIVNGLPITKIDVIHRAKLLHYSLKKNNQFENLSKLYKQSLQKLINENIMISAGLELNRNIETLVKKRAYQITLSRFQNSEKKLNDFIKKLSISKQSVLNKYESELIWATVLKNTFKQDIINTNEKVESLIKQEKLNNNKDKYDLAEIVIPRKNNIELLNKILKSLDNGISFSKIAKQVSVSESKKFGGKIGWKTFEELPEALTSSKSLINSNDLFNYKTKDTFNIVKVLSKRIKGKVNQSEDLVLLAQINFKINFGNKENLYSKIKDKISFNLINKNNCNSLKQINYDKDTTLKVIKSRILDLDISMQKQLVNLKLLQTMKPFYNGNNGYLFVLCDKVKARIKEFNPSQIKNSLLEKKLIVLSAKLLKKLTRNSTIVYKNKLN